MTSAAKIGSKLGKEAVKAQLAIPEAVAGTVTSLAGTVSSRLPDLSDVADRLPDVRLPSLDTSDLLDRVQDVTNKAGVRGRQATSGMSRFRRFGLPLMIAGAAFGGYMIYRSMQAGSNRDPMEPQSAAGSPTAQTTVTGPGV